MSSFFLLTPFLIYFPRLIPGIETQPWFALGFSAFAIMSTRAGKIGAASVVTAVCLLAVVVSVVGGAPSSAGLATLQFAVGPIFLCGVLAWKPLPPSRRCMALVATILAMLAALELLVPAVYQALAGLFLDRVTVTDGHRGLSVLTPEPTYASISLLYGLILAVWSRRCWGSQFPWVEWVFATLLLLTFSTYALLMMLVLAMLYRPRTVLFCATAAAAVVVLHGSNSGFDPEDSVRAVVAVSRLLSTDFDSLLPSISLLDPSLGYRLISLSAGASTVMVKPLGFGLGCSSVGDAFTAFGWDFTFSDGVLGPELRWGCLKPSSFLTSLLLAYGASAAILLLVIAFAVARLTPDRPVVRWWSPLVLALMILTVQCQTTTPIPWFMIYIALFPMLKATKVVRESEIPIGRAHGAF